MHVDPALNLSGLMRTFEVPGDDIAVLDDFNAFQVAPGPGDIVGNDCPVASDAVRRLSLCMDNLGRLEQRHSGTSDGGTQSDFHKMRLVFHGSFSLSAITLFCGDPLRGGVV